MRLDAVQSVEFKYLTMPLSGQIVLRGVGRQVLISLGDFDFREKTEIVALIIERCRLTPKDASRRLYVRTAAALKPEV